MMKLSLIGHRMVCSGLNLQDTIHGASSQKGDLGQQKDEHIHQKMGGSEAIPSQRQCMNGMIELDNT